MRLLLVAILPLLIAGCNNPQKIIPALSATPALPPPRTDILRTHSIQFTCVLPYAPNLVPDSKVVFTILSSEEPLDEDIQPRLPPGIIFIYPHQLARSRVEGEAVLRLSITIDGSVADATVISSTHCEFSNEALHTLPKLVFTPARHDGIAIPCHLQCSIRFTLNDD